MTKAATLSRWVFFLFCISCSIFKSGARAQGNHSDRVLKNGSYIISVLKDGTVALKNKDGANASFRPDFTVLYRFDDPGLSQLMDSTSDFIVPCWKGLRVPDRTPVQYDASEQVQIKASLFQIKNNTITWIFPSQPLFGLTATLILPQGMQEPKLSFYTKKRWLV
jgi:hypothetical protein